MTSIRNAVAGIALGSVLLTLQAHASEGQRPTPPAQWAQYFEQVRKADAIADDEARCNAYPDLPGNEWRAGAVQGRCSVLRKPAWSLDDIDRLLGTPEGVAELERGFATLLDAHYRDQSQRDQIFVALAEFDDSDRAGQVARRWLALAPKSPFANTAAGNHYDTAGWEARGTRWARETSEDQLRRMSELFSKAVPLYLRALELQPRLSVACRGLNGIGRMSSDALQAYASAHCTKVDPDSYYVALERMVSAEPRWGGSDEQLRRAVAYAAARTDRNPMMGALLGEAVGYQPSLANDLGTVADELAAAARLGPSATQSSNAGRGYRSKGDPWQALVYLSQAVRFRPNEAANWERRASLLFDELGDAEWARSDLKMALQEKPGDSRSLYQLGRITQAQGDYVAARPYFEQAMKGELRQAAMEKYCQTYMLPTFQPKPADACTRDLITEFPESGEGWRLRAWTLRLMDDPGVLEAVERFTRYAEDTQLNRDSLEKIRNDWTPDLDRLRAKRDATGTAAQGKK
jgi:tetratricopeptide (TPR) repeat protein